jgi:hypothetical protein
MTPRVPIEGEAQRGTGFALVGPVSLVHDDLTGDVRSGPAKLRKEAFRFQRLLTWGSSPYLPTSIRQNTALR